MIDDALQPNGDLFGALKRNKEHAAGAHDFKAKKRQAGHDAVCEIEDGERLVGSPLTGDETDAHLRNNALHQVRPAFS